MQSPKRQWSEETPFAIGFCVVCVVLICAAIINGGVNQLIVAKLGTILLLAALYGASAKLGWSRGMTEVLFWVVSIALTVFFITEYPVFDTFPNTSP